MTVSIAVQAASNSVLVILESFKMSLFQRKSLHATVATIGGLCVAVAMQCEGLPVASQRPLNGFPGQPGIAPLAGLPLFFEANRGQALGNAQFLARGQNYQFLLSGTEAFLVLRRVAEVAPLNPLDRRELMGPHAFSTRTLKMSFLGSDPEAQAEAENQIDARINYLTGSDPSAWRTGVPAFERVRVRGLYRGIDMVYYGNQRRLEYDFDISPRIDPSTIQIRFDGADRLSISDAGELVIALGGDEIRQPKPELYQVVNGVRKTVTGNYLLLSHGTVGFAVGRYDRNLPLVIDPFLSYASYFGGNAGDIALGIKISTNDDSVVIVGQTLSTTFPFAVPAGAFQPGFAGGAINGDAFVAKLDITLTNLRYFTYLGGTGNDGALDVAVDGSGNAYVSGFTDSTNFPTTNALYSQIGGTFDPKFQAFPADIFVAELDSAGTGLIFSTYLGGSDVEVGGAIAVDPAGNSYITGYTASTNFPTLNAFSATNHGHNDAFVAKIGPGGTPLIYSTYLGGTNADEGDGIAADSAGNAYVSGYTSSTNFPTLRGFRSMLNGVTNSPIVFDAFVVKFDPAGALLCSTLLGGTNGDSGFRLALDSANSVYVTGSTTSGDFPNTRTNVAGLHGGITSSNLFNTDGFLSKISFPSNTAVLDWSVVFGGTNNDAGWGVALDAANNSYVIGITTSTNFPTINTNGALGGKGSGSNDVFVIAFNTNASALLYSTYLGGSRDDMGYGIAVDGGGNAFIVGKTLSTNFPVTQALQPSLSGTNDAFIAKISMDPTLVAVKNGNQVVVQWQAYAPEFVLQANPDLNTTNWTFFSGAPSASNGWHSVTVPATNGADFFRLIK
jgi:hypothetical protein